MDGADLSYARLYSVDLTDASIAVADFSRAALRETEFTGVTSDETVTWTGAIYEDDDVLPQNADTAAMILVSTELDLAGADLSGQYVGAFWNLLSDRNADGINLSGAFLGEGADKVSFVEADLSGVRAERSAFREVNLSGANATDGHFEQAYFNEADLSGTNFTNADLRGARFVALVSLENANFTGANLRDAAFVNWRHLDLSSVQFSGTICPDGTFSDYNPLQTCLGHMGTVIEE